jgi:hypothetical protein
LSLTVIPPENLLLSSSVPELAPDDNGHFTASLGGLPESNISITLGSPATEENAAIMLII